MEDKKREELTLPNLADSNRLPPLTHESGVKLDVLMELFFKQMMTFSGYINDTKGLVADSKYAYFVVYALQKRLQEETKNEWTNVGRELPIVGDKVRVKNASQEADATFCQWSGGFYFKIGNYANQVWEPTHWKPLGDI